MNVVDSSAWFECFTNAPNASFFLKTDMDARCGFQEPTKRAVQKEEAVVSRLKNPTVRCSVHKQRHDLPPRRVHKATIGEFELGNY